MKNVGLVIGLLFCISGKRSKAGKKDDFTEEERDQLVEKHNEIRFQAKASNMMFMEWDNDLAKKAKENVRNCDLERINTDDAVNVYLGRHASPWAIVSLWKENVNDPSKPGFKCISLGGSCAYVQMVIADCTKFGCARNYCEDDKEYITVCHYEKKYDMDKQPFKRSRACSECGGSGAKCNLREELCMTKEQCEDWNKDKCECRLECHIGILDEDRCECVCPECDAEGRPLKSGTKLHLPIIRSVMITGISLLFLGICRHSS